MKGTKHKHSDIYELHVVKSCNLPWDNLVQECWNNQSKGRFSSKNQNPVGLLKGENMLGGEMFSN